LLENTQIRHSLHCFRSDLNKITG